MPVTITSRQKQLELSNYIRSFNGTQFTLREICHFVELRFSRSVDYRWVHKVLKNQRHYDPNYVPIKRTYRKLTPETKEYILSAEGSRREIQEKLAERGVEISQARISQLRKPEEAGIELVVG